MIRALFLTFIFSSLQLQAQSTMSPFTSDSVFTTDGIFKAPGAFQPKVNLNAAIYNDSGYLRDVGYIPMIQEGRKGCENNSVMAFTNPRLDNLGKMFMEMSCKEIDKLKVISSLDPQICLQLASCLQTKMKTSDSDRFELMRTAREKTAQDAIAMMAKSAINPMFKFEELKKYAFDKYGPEIIPDVCYIDPLSIPDDGKCKTNAIDKGFEISQQLCQIPDDGCQPGYIEFIQDKKTEDGQTSLLSNFIKEQSAKKSMLALSEDSRITNELASMMTDKSIQPEFRIKKIMAFLSKNHNDLDPIFRSYYDESTKYVINKKPDEVEAGLLKYIKSNANKDTLEVLVDLERLKQVKAREMLSEQCPKVMTVKNLCKIASDVMIGAEVVIPAENFGKLLKRNGTLAKYPGISKSEMIQAVSQCNTFVLDSTTTMKKGVLTKLGGDRDLFTANDAGIFIGRTMEIPLYGVIIPTFGTPIRASYKVEADGSVSKQLGTYSSSKEQISSTEIIKTAAVKSSALDQFANNLLPDKITNIEYKNLKSADKVDIEGSGSLSKRDDAKFTLPISENAGGLPLQGQNALAGTNNTAHQMIQRSVDPMIDTAMTDYTAKAESNAKANRGNTDYNQLLNKISGLEEKLAASKKATTTSAESSSANDQRPVSEESDLMKELRNAKAVLNEAKKASATLANNNNSSSDEGPPSGSRKKIQSDDREDTSESDSTAVSSGTSTASASRASVNPAQRVLAATAESATAERSGVSVDEGKSSSRSLSASAAESSSAASDGIVLTRLDGVTHAKVNETINNLIAAQSGRPFYIEEGGMVKQIIPEVVDGKVLLNLDGSPVYKTVIKGKVGQFKVDSKNKIKAQKEIAKVTSPADVKMHDYQENTPAVRYKQLLEIFHFKK